VRAMVTQSAEAPRTAERTPLYTQVEQALAKVQDPCAVALRTDWSLVDLGLLVDVYVGERGDLVVEMVLTDPLCPYYDRIERSVQDAVSAATGYPEVTMEISGDVAWEPNRLQKQDARRRSLPLLPIRFREHS
jgi:metal-sulfur cluster biosynthetic enzyme